MDVRLFLVLSLLFEVLCGAKLAYSIAKARHASGFISRLSRLSRCFSWICHWVGMLRSLLWGEKTMIDNEVASLRLAWSHKFLCVYAFCTTCSIVSIQYNMVLGRARWMSPIATWSSLVLQAGFTVYLLCPNLVDKSTLNGLYFLGMLMAGSFLSPWHSESDQLLDVALIIFIFARLPLILLCTRPFIVLFCNLCLLTATVYRAYTDDEVELEGSLGSAYHVLWVEAGTCIITLVSSIALQQMLIHKVELKIQSDNAATQFGAASSLLTLMCDAVVELDSNFCLTEHSSALAAMLLKSNNISGASLLSFMPSEDAERALRHLQHFGAQFSTVKRSRPTPVQPAHAFHTHMVDSCATRLSTETRHDFVCFCQRGLLEHNFFF